MSLHTEVWLGTLVENFFPDDSFASKSIDDSEHADQHHTVHIPNAGKPSKVQVNRPSLPATIGKREDNELTYDIDELTSDPVLITNIEDKELSYDKRRSVLANDKENLQDVACQMLLYRWMPRTLNKGTNLFFTTGEARVASTSETAQGKRRKLTRADLVNLMIRFNKDGVPKEDRYLLVDPEMHADLLSNLSEAEAISFQSSFDAKKGIVGKIYSFNIMERSQVLRLNENNELIKWDEDGDAKELSCAMAWQKSCVSRAMGKCEMFSQEKDPTYYGDIYSFLMRTGGAQRRYDGKGVALLAEGFISE